MGSLESPNPPVNANKPDRASSGNPSYLRGLGVLLVIGLLIFAFIVVPNELKEHDLNKQNLCANRLHQIVMTLEDYRQANGHYPPAALVDENGRPMHSWRILILPYLGDEDAQRVYEQYDFDEPWDGSHNAELSAQMPSLFACPNADGEPGETHFLAVVGPQTLWPDPTGPTPTRRYVTDGPRETIAIVESSTGINWLEPRDLSFEEAVAASDSGASVFGSRHPAGATVAFVDSHIEHMKNTTPPDLLRALLTTGGGEDVGEAPYFEDE